MYISSRSRTRRYRARGPYAVRHARIKQQNKHLKRTTKQLHYSFHLWAAIQFTSNLTSNQIRLLPLRAEAATTMKVFLYLIPSLFIIT